MSAGWISKRLIEVCQIRPPKEEARKKLSASDKVSFVPMEDLHIDQMVIAPKQEKSLSDVVGSYTYFSNGDVLLAKITPCFENGKLGIADHLRNGIGFGSSEFIVLRPNAEIEKEWLYYYLSRQDFREEGEKRMSGAVGQKRVSKEFIETSKIPVPPLPEQQRIVRILDEAFAAIAVARANAEKNLRNARELFESYLNAVFTRRGEGWVERTLKELATIMYGYTESATDRRIGPKFLRITDIQNNVVNWENVPYCKISNEDKPKYLLNGGDIVFARTGATTGKSYLVKDPPEAVFASYLIRVQIDNNELLPDFLYLFFQSSNYWDSIQTGISGSAQGGFNATKLGELRIPYPISTNEQKNLVSDLSEINIVTNNLGLIHQQKINFLDELKQSLLHHAFTGQL